MGAKRIALVTGSASGIGYAIAKQLCADGLCVVMADRSDTIREAAERLSAGGETRAYQADLADERQILALTDYMKENFGCCDVLVNNAGISPKKNGGKFSLPEVKFADWELVFRINLSAPFLLCRELVPLMQESGWGRVINVTSRAGRTYAEPVSIHYSASKAGLIGMTRQIAGDYARYGITANCIAPGRIETPLSKQNSESIIAKAITSIPAGRLGTPDETAAVARFLASDEASYITGAIVDVNGGAFMP